MRPRRRILLNASLIIAAAQMQALASSMEEGAIAARDLGISYRASDDDQVKASFNYAPDPIPGTRAARRAQKRRGF